MITHLSVRCVEGTRYYSNVLGVWDRKIEESGTTRLVIIKAPAAVIPLDLQ